MSERHNRDDPDRDDSAERSPWDDPSPERIERGFDFDPADPFLRPPPETPPSSIPEQQEPRTER